MTNRHILPSFDPDKNDPHWIKLMELEIPAIPFILEAISVSQLNADVGMVEVVYDDEGSLLGVADDINAIYDSGASFLVLFGCVGPEGGVFKVCFYLRLEPDDLPLLEGHEIGVDQVVGTPTYFEQLLRDTIRAVVPGADVEVMFKKMGLHKDDEDDQDESQEESEGTSIEDYLAHINEMMRNRNKK